MFIHSIFEKLLSAMKCYGTNFRMPYMKSSYPASVDASAVHTKAPAILTIETLVVLQKQYIDFLEEEIYHRGTTLLSLLGTRDADVGKIVVLTHARAVENYRAFNSKVKKALDAL